MFIACTELFKIGVGPSSSHTMGPMLAAETFRQKVEKYASSKLVEAADCRVRCTLFGSLAHTGSGHGTDEAILLGLHGYTPLRLAAEGKSEALEESQAKEILKGARVNVIYDPSYDLIWDTDTQELTHPNTMLFELLVNGEVVLFERSVSIGGGFVVAEEDLHVQALNIVTADDVPYPFSSAREMLAMADESGLSIAQMKRANECHRAGDAESVESGISEIWAAMVSCIEGGLMAEGVLPGKLKVHRRARNLHAALLSADELPESHEWLSVFAIAVNEQNAGGEMVVTAPTNGAAGVIPAVLYFMVKRSRQASSIKASDIEDFFLTAAAIGGLIKHNSSISGAEVGCQGEVGTAAAMAAAGLCAIKGGSPRQVEHAAEIALEHHLGMTCDPVSGLVQVPCIERNAFGAVKAWLAADLALRGGSAHVMSLDSCIKAMHETGLEMSSKYKETSLGGLASSWVEC